MINVLSRVTLTQMLVVLYFVKLLLFGSSIGEGVSLLVLFLALRAEIVLALLIPKQPDIFSELTELNQSMKTLTEKNEVLERQVAGLSLQTMRPRL